MKPVLTFLIIFVLSLNLYAQSPEETRFARSSFGLGLGIPYGILGINGEFAVWNNFSITGGVGTTILAGVGYNVGGKYYFRNVGNTWRPRISAYYGTNAVAVVIGGNSDDDRTFSGITFGIGQQWMWGKNKSHGIDLDILYIASSKVFDRTDENGRVKFSIGYRMGF
ncbi:hypothetical protein JNL27_09160 [bacterium]|nr:hypothetical protein [bacterium]